MRLLLLGAALGFLLAAPPAPGLAPAAVVPIELTGCEYVEVAARVPPEWAAPMVPAPFSPRLVLFTNIVLMGGGTCASAVSGGEQGPASFGWTSVVLNPPEDPVLRGEGVAVFLYRLEHLVTDDLYRRVALAAGAEMLDVDTIAADAEAAPSQLLIAGPGWEHRILAPVTPPDPPVLGFGGLTRWREFHDLGPGYAMLEATLAPDAAAGSWPGVVLAGPGTAAAQVLGPLNAGTVTYGEDFGVLDGSMTVLPK